MISKEQYKEILSKNGSLYFVDLTYKKVIEQKAQNTKFIDFSDHPEIHFYSDEGEMFWKIELKHLFETKEEAEWQLEFGNITRTETLKLPTWEEAQKKLEVEIYAPKGRKYLLETKIITGYSCERENPYIIRIDRIGYADSQIDFEYTKENYIKACRLAKKLFLEGSDE